MDSLDRLIELALEEDLAAPGDITTQALLIGDEPGRGELWAKEPMVIAGLDAFVRVFEKVDSNIEAALHASNGDSIKGSTRVATLSGRLASMLIAERVALNLVQRASGIATATRRAVEALGNSKVKLLDTRKTPPGMRQLAKAAVRAGGGHNHRFGLFDGILIKDNHLAAVGGSIRKALQRARDKAPRLVKVEIEVTTLAQLAQAIDEGADIVLLDNMDDVTLAKAVKMAGGRVELEASGGITLE